MAPGVHPNFTEKHEEHHRPELNKGLVISIKLQVESLVFFSKKLQHFITFRFSEGEFSSSTWDQAGAVYVKLYGCHLNAGADPNLGSVGKTPLIVAACEGDAGIIKYLLKAGANPNIADVSGMTPLEHSALCGNVTAAMALFPCTSRISSFPDWSVNGIMNHVHSEEANAQREIKRKIDFETSKAKGREAFERKDYDKAIFWYTQASHADPNDEAVLSNRSLCWAMLNEGGYALIDAVACVALKPDWAKAHYREGAACMLLNEYTFASEAFSKARELDPDNKEILKAHREAVEAEFGMPVSECFRSMRI